MHATFSGVNSIEFECNFTLCHRQRGYIAAWNSQIMNNKKNIAISHQHTAQFNRQGIYAFCILHSFNKFDFPRTFYKCHPILLSHCRPIRRSVQTTTLSLIHLCLLFIAQSHTLTCRKYYINYYLLLSFFFVFFIFAMNSLSFLFVFSFVGSHYSLRGLRCTRHGIIIILSSSTIGCGSS